MSARGQTNWTYSDVRSTLDNEAVGETVKANGTTLLIQVDLLFRQEVSNSAAGTKSRIHKKYRTQNVSGYITPICIPHSVGVTGIF